MADSPGFEVECYSGHTYAQEPRAVVLQGQRSAVTRVEERWRTPEGPAFRVLLDSGERLELHYSEPDDRWAVQALPGCDAPSRCVAPDVSKDKEVLP